MLPTNQEIGCGGAILIAALPGIAIALVIGFLLNTSVAHLAAIVGIVAVIVGCAYLAGLAQRRKPGKKD